MGQMKELFISMQEGLMQGITITNAQREREFNPDNEKHVEIMQETQQAMEENSYGDNEEEQNN